MNRTVVVLGLRFLSTPLGTVYFKLTKGKFIHDKKSKQGDLWWYGYLFNFASRMNLKKILKKNKGYRAVRVLRPEFDYYYYYNTVFHLDCLSHIIYELSQGYIPVIDDHHHVWSQLFEQPVVMAEKEIGDLSQLPESDEHSILHKPTLIPYSKSMRKVWTKLIRTFSRLKPDEQKYVQDEIRSILKDDRVLGVVCRGTDYIGTGMPRQPEVSDVIAEAKAWMKRYNYEKIYLATEVESIYEQFESAFPGKILVNKRTYYDKAMAEQKVKWIGLVRFDRENDNYWKGLEYLSSIYILANCKALLGGYCGASNMALLFNGEQYERFKVYDLGIEKKKG